MEDAFVVAYQQTDDKKDLEYAFFGIFDGHGGKEAALYAKNNLLDNIVNFKNFWQDDDELVLKAIRDGFLTTHLAMWKEVDNWPKTSSGLPSTAGTTASIAFIRKGKLYTGHVGDSRIVLGLKEENSDEWQAECLTTDHKPECPVERQRIVESGGLVMNKSGVERVVWKRPRPGHQGPVLRSTDFDEIPFLAVARSLGDLWSYDYFQQEFVVSPEPDLGVMTLDLKKDVCIILATDGLWNMMSGQDAVSLVQDVENENRNLIAKFGVSENTHLTLCNPSKVLVDCALERWNRLQVRADNTSVVTVMLDLASSSEMEVGKEQLTLKMNYPRSLQVWNVTKQSKNSSDVPKESEDSLSASDNDSENQSDFADFDPKLLSAEKLEQDCSSHIESDRHTSSPLQSCSNFLPEYFSSASPKGSKKNEIEGIENSPCPFPRWSKSASGRTSLSKLATWSKVVSHRRMSDPFPHRSIELAHTSTDEMYSLSDDEDSNHCFHNSYLCENRIGRPIRQNEKNTSEDMDSSSVITSFTKPYLGLKNSSSDDKIYKTALDQLCSIKQAIKRKYPGTEISQSYISNSEDLEKLDGGSSQKRKPDLINLSTLKVANILLDSES